MRRGRKSPAERKRANNAAFRFLAAGSLNPRAHELLAMQQTVREYKPRAPVKRVEAGIVDAIHRALLKHPSVAKVERRSTGVFRDGDRWIRVGKKGTPDITGILHGGKAFGIEVKRPGEYPNDAQWREIYAIRNAGGFAGCAHSVDEALAIIDG